MENQKKVCNKCKKELFFSEFHKNKNGKFGLNGDCKKCYNEKRKETTKADKEFNDKKKRWREKNKKENNVFYWNKRARTINYNCENLYGIKEKVNGNDLKSLYDSMRKCNYCETPLKNDECHIDHITPLNKGGKNEISNLTISCPSCNFQKSKKSQKEFYEYIKKIYNKLKPFYE